MAASWKVLAAVDLHADAEEMVRNALAFATALSADVEFLHVRHPGAPVTKAIDWPPSALRPPSYQVDVSRRVLQGANLAETIVAHAEAIGANVIWIAAHRYGRWNRFWRKSVVDELMSATNLPVCVAREDDSGQYFRFRKRRILCALGLDRKDADLVRYAESIAKRSAAELVLLHVVPEISEASLHEAASGGARPLGSGGAAAKLAAIARQLDTPATTSAMMGDPASCIALAAREHGADLVVMSRDAANSRAAYGSYLERLFGRLRCPLVTVPADAGETSKHKTIRLLPAKVIHFDVRPRDSASAVAAHNGSDTVYEKDRPELEVVPIRHRRR